MNELEIYIDGASSGNPGPSGVGIAIYQDAQVVKQVSSFIGNATNNIAEYTAFIYALQESLILKAQTLRVYSDSELLCRQLNRQYKVKSPNIVWLFDQAQRLMAGFKQVTLTHIPREQNAVADRLATQAVKQASRDKRSG